MTWLRLLHLFGLTNLSDEEVRMYEQIRASRSALAGIAKLQDQIARATSLHELGRTLPRTLKLEFSIAVGGLALPLREYAMAGYNEAETSREEHERNVRSEQNITELVGEGVDQELRGRVKEQMQTTQREYYLNETLRAIRTELGDVFEAEIVQLQAKMNNTNLPIEVKERVDGELKRLSLMKSETSEAATTRNSIEWILDLPWGKYRDTVKDLQYAQRILDEDHFGLSHIKEQALEYIAVQIRTELTQGQVLCIVGPPGVGKTSLAKSMARATGREFIRISLGGVRDEATIRGHRRTYIGSLPGKIIHAMRQAKCLNPLILLDEVDKISRDARDDPTSALLEVLDPEQNRYFMDHYLNVPFDLSSVLFLATANSLNIPAPLLDRMEVIFVPGYTENEKLEIAKRHLIPNQAIAHGLSAGEWGVTDEALKRTIRFYTREAGVRNLDREIASLARKAVCAITLEGAKTIYVDAENLPEFLGIERYHYGEAETTDLVGVAAALAWTEMGGDLLSVESVMMPGSGLFTLTGKLGEVMQDSARAARMYVRTGAASLDIDPSIFSEKDIHVHVPEGSIAKDGPAAGVAMIVSIVSAITGKRVRRDVAMTGEITLRGRVLLVGGLREKVLAANRGGISTVIIPDENLPELATLDDDLKRGIKFIPIRMMSDVFEHVFVK